MDEARRKKTRFSLTVYFLIIGICFGSWASRIPDIKEHLSLSEGMLGSLLLMLPLGQMTMMPFSGRIAARFGSRYVLRLALMGYVSMLVLIGHAQSSWQLALALYGFGLCGNMGNISVNTQGVQLEKLYGRSIFSALHGVWSVGGFCGAAIGLLMMKFDIKPAYHFISIAVFIALNNLYFQQFLLPKPAVQVELPKWRLRKPKGILLQLGIMCFCSMSVEGCMFDWTGVYFKEVIQAPGQYVSLGYALFMISMASGRFLGDCLAERFGRKRMVMSSGMMIFCGLMLMVAFPLLWISALGCVIVGFGVSTIVPLLYSSAGKLKMIPSSVAIASVAGIGYFGFLMGPPMIGFIAEATGLRVSLAIIALGGLLIAWVVRNIRIIS